MTESILKNGLVKYSKFTHGLDEKVYLDWDGDRVEGTFYEPELQAVNVDPSTEYHNEKLLKRRLRNKQKKSWCVGYTGQRNTIVGYQKQM